MPYYLITWHESDGNDCTVFDTVVHATDKDAALTTLSDAIEKSLDENGTEYENGGDWLDYYFSCSEDCDQDCEGHGGIVLREVEEYPSEADARSNMARYHSEWSL